MNIIVDISDHPSLAGISRKVKYNSITISDDTQTVTLKVTVMHYDSQGNHISGTVPDKREVMIASNQSRVDSQGALVQKYVYDGSGNITYLDAEPVINPDWESATPEWDFLNAIAESGSMDIYALIQNTITNRAVDGRFDSIY